MKRLRLWFSWWRWFLGGPSIARLVMSGVDADSRRVIYVRHDRKEPKHEQP